MSNTTFTLSRPKSVLSILNEYGVSLDALVSANPGHWFTIYDWSSSSDESIRQNGIASLSRSGAPAGAVVQDSTLTSYWEILSYDGSVNNKYFYYKVKEVTTLYKDAYIRECYRNKTLLPAGMRITIPLANSGGTTTAAASQSHKSSTSVTTARTSQGKSQEVTYNTVPQSSSSDTSRDTKPWEKFNCWMQVFLSGSSQGIWYLPVYPNEFSDTNNGNFSDVHILGRSVGYQVYNTSGRDVSFTLQLHEELCGDDYDYIHKLVAQVQSACYPGYGAGGVVSPPEVRFVIGDHFKIRGVLTNAGANWKAPIIDGRLVNCDLSIAIKETTGPYSRSQIANMGGKRG